MRALLRIAVVWNIPIACNRATADYLTSSPLLASNYQPDVPDYVPRFEHAPRPVQWTGRLVLPSVLGAGDQRAASCCDSDQKARSEGIFR